MAIGFSSDVYVIGRDNAKPFLLADMPNGEDVKLMQPLSFTIPNLPIFGKWAGMEVYVPAGFVSDYASVPRLFWRLIPRRGTYNKAAFIHDYLYVVLKMPRRLADLVFYHAMLALEVPKWKAVIMHKAVRSGGWVGWRRNARLRDKFPHRLRLRYGLSCFADLSRPKKHPKWEFSPA